MQIGNSVREIPFDSLDIFSGMDFSERYEPEARNLPFKKNGYDSQIVDIVKDWLEITFSDDYLLDNKANIKNLPANSVWKESHQRVGFTSQRKRVLVPSFSVDMTSNAKYYPVGTYAQKIESSKFEIFRNEMWDLYHQMIDAGLYFGNYMNDPANGDDFHSFKSSSTDPNTVGLPSTVVGGSSSQLIDLIESGIEFLKDSGSKKTSEKNIHLIVGSKIYRQSYGVISGGMNDFGMPTFPKLFDNKYTGSGVTVSISPLLGNNLIMCDKTMVELIFAQGFNIEAAIKRFTSDFDTFKASCGLCALFLSDPTKSLFYSDVLQESEATLALKAKGLKPKVLNPKVSESDLSKTKASDAKVSDEKVLKTKALDVK